MTEETEKAWIVKKVPLDELEDELNQLLAAQFMIKNRWYQDDHAIIVGLEMRFNAQQIIMQQKLARIPKIRDRENKNNDVYPFKYNQEIKVHSKRPYLVKTVDMVDLEEELNKLFQGFYKVTDLIPRHITEKITIVALDRKATAELGKAANYVIGMLRHGQAKGENPCPIRGCLFLADDPNMIEHCRNQHGLSKTEAKLMMENR